MLRTIRRTSRRSPARLKGLPCLCRNRPCTYAYDVLRCDCICSRRSDCCCKQSVRFHLRAHSCGRSVFPVSRPVLAFQRFPDSGRRRHHHLCKGNPEPHRGLIRLPQKGRSANGRPERRCNECRITGLCRISKMHWKFGTVSCRKSGS